MKSIKRFMFMVMMVFIGLSIISPQPLFAQENVKEDKDKTLDGMPSKDLEKKVTQIVESLPSMPSKLKRAIPPELLKDWKAHLASVISGLIPRQDHYYGESDRNKKVYLVWYCLSPHEVLPDDLEEKAKDLIILTLKTDWLGDLVWKWIKPAMRKGFLLLDKQEQKNIREYLAHSKETLRTSSFYAQESRHWQKCLNKKTHAHDFAYEIMSDVTPELKNYIGTGAYEFINFDPYGEKRGEFAKLEIWIFRRIHFDGVKPYQLKKWVGRLQQISALPK